MRKKQKFAHVFPHVDRNGFIGFDITLTSFNSQPNCPRREIDLFMMFPLSSPLFLDDTDDADDAEDADDFDFDYDEDYEILSDEEFEVFIDYDEYDANDLDLPDDDFCLDDDIDGFSGFDTPDETIEEKDFVDEE